MEIITACHKSGKQGAHCNCIPCSNENLRHQLARHGFNPTATANNHTNTRYESKFKARSRPVELNLYSTFFRHCSDSLQTLFRLSSDVIQIKFRSILIRVESLLTHIWGGCCFSPTLCQNGFMNIQNPGFSIRIRSKNSGQSFD